MMSPKYEQTKNNVRSIYDSSSDCPTDSTLKDAENCQKIAIDQSLAQVLLGAKFEKKDVMKAEKYYGDLFAILLLFYSTIFVSRPCAENVLRNVLDFRFTAWLPPS